MNSKGVYEYDVPFCKHYSSRKLIKTSYNNKLLIDDKGKRFNVKVQRYKCKKCDKYSKTEF